MHMEENTQSNQQQTEYSEPVTTVPKSVQDGKVCAILSYLAIGIIWYFADETMRKNDFAKFHSKQAIGLIVFSIVIHIIGIIVPVIGWWIVLPLGQLLVIVFAIIGIVNAANGSKKRLPIIGEISETNLKY